MKKLKILVTLLLATMCASVVFGQQKPIIAVYVVPDGADNADAKAIKKILEAKLVEAIDKSNLFTATERSETFLSQLRKERDYQQSGNVRDDQIARLAKESGAKYLCIAEISEVFGEKFVNARLIETESNNISGTANSSGAIKSMNNLVSIAAEVSSKLIQETPQGKAAERARNERQAQVERAKWENKSWIEYMRYAMNKNPTRIYPSGNKYKGQEQRSKKGYYYTNGVGALYFSNVNDKGVDDDFYFGNWLAGKKNGDGIFLFGTEIPKTCPGCKYYCGDWKNERISGKGRCYDKTGKLIYFGDFRYNTPLGNYPTIDSSYSLYRFEAINHPNGVYVGETKGGRKHGKGFYIWDMGDMWYGNWKDDISDGEGMFIYVSGKTQKGTINHF